MRDGDVERVRRAQRKVQPAQEGAGSGNVERGGFGALRRAGGPEIEGGEGRARLRGGEFGGANAAGEGGDERGGGEVAEDQGLRMGLEQRFGPLGEAVVGDQGDEDALRRGRGSPVLGVPQVADQGAGVDAGAARADAVPGEEIEIGGRDRAGRGGDRGEFDHRRAVPGDDDGFAGAGGLHRMFTGRRV